MDKWLCPCSFCEHWRTLAARAVLVLIFLAFGGIVWGSYRVGGDHLAARFTRQRVIQNQ